MKFKVTVAAYVNVRRSKIHHSNTGADDLVFPLVFAVNLLTCH